MIREELVAKKLEIENELDQIAQCMINGKKYSQKKYNNLLKERNSILADLDEIDGLIYNDEEWIAKKFYISEKSLSDARLGLAKILSKLNGVEVEEKSGVQKVTVNTKWKVYRFVIHAHYTCEEVEWEEREVKSVFSKEVIRTEKVCTKYKYNYTAWLDRDNPYWHWKY